ncbi:MAG TPA: hypothetical protein VNH18_23490 [Bryobacteraceae bacterium]|nr:hypothetical protein [Blastocatellia bacterium]HXJ42263.1 hypothetical protein [Bryobacteraceae bacterium]
MTERQKKRLIAAERVCSLVARDTGAGFDDRRYEPNVITALHMMQRRAEELGNFKPGSCHPIGDLAKEIESALHAWLSFVGIDPATYAKSNAALNYMALAKDALGPEYEAEFVEQAADVKFKWPERTADERAAGVAGEFFAGRIKGFDELRIAIAGEILESETKAREPFLDYARRIFAPIAAGKADSDDEVKNDWAEAMREFLQSTAVYFPDLLEAFNKAARVAGENGASPEFTARSSSHTDAVEHQPTIEEA